MSNEHNPWDDVTAPIGCLFWMLIIWLVFLGGCNLIIERAFPR